MEENQLTKHQKEYMRKYLKRKVFIFFLYLCAAGNQCLIIMLGSVLTGYDPKLCWLFILCYFFGAIALVCFIELIIDYSVEQDAKDDKNRNNDNILEYAEIEKRIEDALNDKKNNKQINVMKLIAKKGSSLEEQIKNDYEKMIHTREEALSFIEERTGIKPSNIGYVCLYGYTCIFDLQFLFFESEEKINKNLFVKNTEANCYRISIRTKKGLKLYEDFLYIFNYKYLNYRPYEKFGIFFQDAPACSRWEPHKEADRYMIIWENSMMDKLKDVDNAQYTIMP